MLAHGPGWPTAWERVDARCDELVGQDLAAGGSAELVARVRRFVDRHRAALSECHRPVLCHNDFIGSNILVAADVLTSAYGAQTESERHRLDVHEVLHALQERTWISYDRPAGWQRSIAALETFLVERT